MNAELPIPDRVEFLLSKMSIAEKVNQLTSDYAKTDGKDNGPGDIGLEFKVRLEQGLGSVQFVNLPHDAAVTAAFANAIQNHVLDNIRRGIPVLLAGEACHGLIAHKATSFPQAIALASTWNPGLVERAYALAALEARSRGFHLMNTPVLDLARDPRWGRMEETYGEDVYLVTQMGLAAVNGLQGIGETVEKTRVATALKHFAAYAQCGGRAEFRSDPGAEPSF